MSHPQNSAEWVLYDANGSRRHMRTKADVLMRLHARITLALACAHSSSARPRAAWSEGPGGTCTSCARLVAHTQPTQELTNTL
eukprot:3244647-Pleurochrysis_carterae.AAC.2